MGNRLKRCSCLASVSDSGESAGWWERVGDQIGEKNDGKQVELANSIMGKPLPPSILLVFTNEIPVKYTSHYIYY